MGLWAKKAIPEGNDTPFYNVSLKTLETPNTTEVEEQQTQWVRSSIKSLSVLYSLLCSFMSKI